MKTYAYIDASNLFYGGKKSLGWSIDCDKLKLYLSRKYGVKKIYFFGGVEIHKFQFDYISMDTVPIEELEQYFVRSTLAENTKSPTETKLVNLNLYLKRVRFYIKLKKFGFDMVLKPVKTYTNNYGTERKANCDVDMTLQMLKDINTYDRIVFISGDGDFLPVLKYIRTNRKEIVVLARSPRTAKEIKRFAGDKFVDFEYLREILKL